MPVAQIDYFALTSRIKRRDDTDLLSEIQAELNNIDNEIKVDDMKSQMARFSQNIDILEYNPQRISVWQDELDSYVPPPQINIPKLNLEPLEIPEELKLEMNDIENNTMGEEQTNKLRSMLTNLINEENSKEQESSDLLTS